MPSAAAWRTVVIISIRINLGSSLSTRLQRRQSSNQPHCHADESDEGRQGCRPTQAAPVHKCDESAQGDESDEGRPTQATPVHEGDASLAWTKGGRAGE